MTRAALIAVVVVLGAACSDRDKPEVKREPERPRRVIEPPSRGVRALPPHAIRADGVGPYKLGAPAAELLEQLPSGPRIRQFTIPGIVHRDMLRGEDEAILIGTEPQGRATFIAVVRGEIARTEAGIQVGSTREELERVLGPPIEDLERARDPRVVIPAKLDNAQIVLDGDRITAIVLTPPIERAGKDPAPEHACARPASDRKRGLFGACLSSGGELVRALDNEIAVLGRDGEKAIAAPARVPGLVFAAPLRHAADGRDELVAIVHDDDEQTRRWSLIVYRLIDGKLMRIVEQTPLYRLTAANARWIGADLRDLELFLEVTAKPDTIEVGGLLATHTGANVRDIVVISTVPVPRPVRRGKAPANELVDAGISDAQDSANPASPTP